MAFKNAEKYTERLDRVANDLQQMSPELALQVDMISDVIDGRREASSLVYDADEARYMANRFNYQVRTREADEPYMDHFNQSDYSQVMKEKRNPKPIRVANAPYLKVKD